MKFTGNPVRSLIVGTMLLFLFSCKGIHKMQEDVYNARDKDHKAFVEKKDGEIIEANEARLRSPLFGKTTIELDQDVRIPIKELRAYQNNEAYYHTTPSGFAPRIKKGLINVYLATSTYTTYESPGMSNGNVGRTKTHTRYIYYLQKGKDGTVETIKPKLVETYVSDYAPAMEYIDLYKQTQKKVATWSWINTAAVVGGLVLAGTSGIDKNDNVTVAGYGGLGLFVGGMVNGFVNKIRRFKNAKNLELAVDTYNSQTVKKKK
jgi:hypothetical protein